MLDSQLRKELGQGIIISEPDYVSNFTGRLRATLSKLGLQTIAHSQNLDKVRENRFGCDAIIVVNTFNYTKVCLFEAKHPKLHDTKYHWDSIQQSSKVSHFTDQLVRQHKWSKDAVIWEMFFHDEPRASQPRGFDNYGSTCVHHDYAFHFDIAYRKSPTVIWQDKDLTNLVNMSKSRYFPRNKVTNIKRLLLDVCECKYGRPLLIDNRQVIITSSFDENERISIPASLEMDNQIPMFCEEFNVPNYLLVELGE